MNRAIYKVVESEPNNKTYSFIAKIHFLKIIDIKSDIKYLQNKYKNALNIKFIGIE